MTPAELSTTCILWAALAAWLIVSEIRLAQAELKIKAILAGKGPNEP